MTLVHRSVHSPEPFSTVEPMFDGKVVDKPLASMAIAPDDRGCLDQSNIGGEAVTVRQRPAGRPAAYPQEHGESAEARGNLIHDRGEDARAFDHEHGRLYAALKVAEERAELAGDVDIASDLRILRRRVARHIEAGRCKP